MRTIPLRGRAARLPDLSLDHWTLSLTRSLYHRPGERSEANQSRGTN